MNTIIDVAIVTEISVFDLLSPKKYLQKSKQNDYRLIHVDRF